MMLDGVKLKIAWILVAACFAGSAGYLALAEPAGAAEPAGTVGPTTKPAEVAPHVVMLDDLVDLYEPVPFDHKTHAMKGDDGCKTCHHNSPKEGEHPACKTCHAPTRNDIRQPSLKGAYHRQCLSCHKDWSGANHCNTCHAPKGTNRKLPTVDEIMGRMHPPIDQPDAKVFRARFTPADGPNVLFRHKEHTQKYGVSCATCHQQETSCVRCHDPSRRSPLVAAAKIARTWDEAHKQCSSCHTRQSTQCGSCHYRDGQPPPAVGSMKTTQPAGQGK